MTLLVTGGAGFIGSALAAPRDGKLDQRVVTLDKSVYAGDIAFLDGVCAGAA